MRIGVDIDGTLNDITKILLQMAGKFNRENNISYQYNREYYETKNIFGWTDEQNNMFWKQYGYAIAKGAEIKDQYVARAIKQIRDLKNEIVIITARPIELYTNTVEWLKENNIQWDELYIGVQDKGEICTEKNIDIMIEDSVEFVTQITKNIHVLLMDNYYNTNCHNALVTRIYTWDNVLSIIENIAA